MTKTEEQNIDLNHEPAITEKIDAPLNSADPLEDIKELVEKNLELSEETLKRTKYIKRYVIVSQVLSVIKILLIAVPLIIGILYLPPLLKSMAPMYKDVIDTYGELIGIKKQIDTTEQKIDINKIPPELQKYLK